MARAIKSSWWMAAEVAPSIVLMRLLDPADRFDFTADQCPVDEFRWLTDRGLSRLSVRIPLAPLPSPRRIEISEEMHEIDARARLREFKGHRRNAHLGDSATVRGDSLRFEFWRWTLASIGIARERPQERGSVRGRARMPRRFDNLKDSDEEAANRRIKSRKRIQVSGAVIPIRAAAACDP